MPHQHTAALLLTASLAALGLPAGADQARDAALGFSGEIYLARSGTCGELFAQCGAGAESFPVLALDVMRPGQPQQRLLVPETLGPEAEGLPAVVFEDASDSLFVVWESKQGPDQSRVNLAWLNGEEWSPLYEISGDVHPLKGVPQVVLTRDRFQLRSEGAEAPLHERTVLNVLWWEQGPAVEEVYYTPVILVDGAYLGHNDVYNLSSFDPNPPSQPAAPLPTALQRAPEIEGGSDARSVVIGFVSPASQRFLVFESQLVPRELSELAGEAQAEIAKSPGPYTPSSLRTLGNRVRSHLIEFGQRLRPSTLQPLTDEARQQIVSTAPAGIANALELGHRVRSHLIEFGTRELGGDGVVTSTGVGASGKLLETRPSLLPRDADAPPHSLHLLLVSDRVAPSVPESSVWFFLSGDGRRAIVAWGENDGLGYRETRGQGWTAVRHLTLDGPVEVTRAEQILRQRVRNQ